MLAEKKEAILKNKEKTQKETAEMLKEAQGILDKIKNTQSEKKKWADVATSGDEEQQEGRKEGCDQRVKPVVKVCEQADKMTGVFGDSHDEDLMSTLQEGVKQSCPKGKAGRKAKVAGKEKGGKWPN